jgi:putative phosphoribosyl transferase
VSWCGPRGGAAEAAFADRRHAGRELATRILAFDAEDRGLLRGAGERPGAGEDAGPTAGEGAHPTAAERPGPVVLALPRGGVPVGFEVAAALNAPLDVLVARKIGAPGNPELGVGAVAEGGVRVLSGELLRGLLVSQEELEHSAAKAEAELRARVELYRAGRAPVALQGRTAIVIDDGLATGGTARAAIRAARAIGAGQVLLATPVGAPSTVRELREEADEVICLLEPEPMWAIGMWYRDFSQVPDEEVLALLRSAQERVETEAQTPASTAATGASPETPARAQVSILYESPPSTIGDLTLPSPCGCLVLFAHGSGSSRTSPRNRQVAAALNSRGVATLLFDLLTPEEELRRINVFDVPLLASRLRQATEWTHTQPQLASLPIGYFGASTGAAAALWAAADLRGQIGAVVSRGGRPDLASPRLAEVDAPTLLIVGGADTVVLDLNSQALRQLHSPSRLEVVPGATHLFEEPGALQEVSRLAAEWFGEHLRGAGDES